MAALSTLQKLLKNAQSPSRLILNSLHRSSPLQRSPNPSQTYQPNSSIISKDNHQTAINFGSFKGTSFNLFDSLPFSSIHPSGLCSNPILAPGSIPDLQCNDDNDSSGMWADSVKKKRKKKMNKHKYKKLRKRLRKQT